MSGPPGGLIRGTLFPGLDLPFMGMVNNTEKSDTPMHELQAPGLCHPGAGALPDTHREDREALELYWLTRELYNKGVRPM